MDENTYTSRRVMDYFGENTLAFRTLKQKLPAEIYRQLERAVDHYEALPADVADAVAVAMKEWAMGRGVTAYTHWFQPLTGLTAEKHESFIAPAGGGWIEDFSGDKLIKSEPDASSFPHGGMRSTFEARGYAAWDPSSPAFIMEGKFGRTLYVPSVFVSYDGYVLDKKTPLIKSMKAVSEAARRLLRLIGAGEADWVYPFAGPEQEYFLVDRAHWEARPDLAILGYTLFGARSPKGQQFGDHYFGAIRDRVLAFMQELEIELFRLGIPAKTRHNEVAPNQFELSVFHERANIAADHNHLVMELLRRVSRRQGLAAILHEKPFARINGSGKHVNWSLIDSRGVNMFDPGDEPAGNLRFLLFTAGVLAGVNRHGDLLRAIIAGPGNDLRLGSHEAPPAVMSVFLGAEISEVLAQIDQGGSLTRLPGDAFKTGVPFVPHFPKDTTDRNRTSPVAFTGNKFEFRAVGSSASVAMPLASLNTLAADGLTRVAEALEAALGRGLDPAAAQFEAVREVYREARQVHFDGDGYEAAWVAEAARRGLPTAPHTPAALDFLAAEKNIKLFEAFHVLRPEEVAARRRVKLEIYVNTVELELKVARILIRTMFLPAGFEYEGTLAETIHRLQDLLRGADESATAQRDYLFKISARLRIILDKLTELDGHNARLKDLPLDEQARFCAETVRPAIWEVRNTVDELEERVDARVWRIPRYWEMLSGL